MRLRFLVAPAALLAVVVSGGTSGAGTPAEKQRLAYVFRGAIFTMASDGSDRRRLTPDGGGDWPAWSPDGTRIAFASDREGSFRLYEMRADGSDVRPLTDAEVTPACCPAWSPGGRRLAFVGGFSLFLLDLRTSSVRPLAGDASLDGVDWSPDGRRIVFASRFRNRPRAYSLWIIGRGGRGLRRLTRGANDFDPDWSPNGRRIVFTRSRRVGGVFRFELFTVRPDGRGLRRLRSDFPLPDTDPAWSPNGRRIAFVTTRQVGAGDLDEISIARADGTRARRFSPRVYGRRPVWQP